MSHWRWSYFHFTAPTTCQCQLDDLRRLSTDDVITAVRLLPDKQCQSDVMPTWMLKCNVDLLAPFLTELFNRSLALVPDVFKAAFITPMLKKPDADAADITQYTDRSRTFQSCRNYILERLVAEHAGLSHYISAAAGSAISLPSLPLD